MKKITIVIIGVMIFLIGVVTAITIDTVLGGTQYKLMEVSETNDYEYYDFHVHLKGRGINETESQIIRINVMGKTKTEILNELTARVYEFPNRIAVTEFDDQLEPELTR